MADKPNKLHTDQWHKMKSMEIGQLQNVVRSMRKNVLQRYSRLGKKYEYTPALMAFERDKSRFKGKRLSKDRDELITTYNILQRLLEHKTSTIRGAEKFKEEFEDEYIDLMSRDSKFKKDFFDIYDRFVSTHKSGANFKYELWREIYEYKVQEAEGDVDYSLQDRLEDVLDELERSSIPYTDEENIPDWW